MSVLGWGEQGVATGPRQPAEAAEIEPPDVPVSGAPPGARVVNTWFDGDAPFPPLRVGRRYHFCLNIGVPRIAVLGTSTPFVEPGRVRPSMATTLEAWFVCCVFKEV